MDINKEREAFEQALVNQKNVSINNLHVCTIFDAEKNKYSPSDVCDPKEDFIVDWINSSWSIWQAAKAQTDQKIKLLLCDEHLKKCESPTGVFNSQYPDEEPCLICLAKQAKAQAVPEGFVLVPKEPTEAMIQRGTKANSECLNENAPLGERLFRHPALQVYQAMVNGSGE